MGQLITQACLENQANAARWYGKSRAWHAVALQCRPTERHYRTAAGYSIEDQDAAARLSRADRLLRGLEA